MKFRHLVRAGLLSLGLAVAVAPATLLASNSGGGKLKNATVFGTVSSITGTCDGSRERGNGGHGATCSFIIATGTGPASVSTAEETDFLPHSSAAAVAGFIVHDAVLAEGKPGASLVAKHIVYDTAPFVVPGSKFRRSVGTVEAATSTQLTLVHAGNALSFTLSAATKYRLNGKSAGPAALIPGDFATVFSRLYTDGQPWAQAVLVRGKSRQ